MNKQLYSLLASSGYGHVKGGQFTSDDNAVGRPPGQFFKNALVVRGLGPDLDGAAPAIKQSEFFGGCFRETAFADYVGRIRVAPDANLAAFALQGLAARRRQPAYMFHRSQRKRLIGSGWLQIHCAGRQRQKQDQGDRGTAPGAGNGSLSELGA